MRTELLEKRFYKWFSECVGNVAARGNTNNVRELFIYKVTYYVILYMDVFNISMVTVIAGQETGSVVVTMKRRAARRREAKVAKEFMEEDCFLASVM